MNQKLKRLGTIVVVGLIMWWAGSKITQETSFWGKEKPTIIMVTFGAKDNSGHWSGEAAEYGNQIKNAKDISKNIGFCQEAYSGYLYNQPVILAISGMAKVKTAACMEDVLKFTQGEVKEVILSGIGGISVNEADKQKTKIGDICVGYLTLDFDRQYYSADLARTFTALPVFWGVKVADNSRYGMGDIKLANELTQASISVTWPETPEDISMINETYGRTDRAVKVWEPEQCLEVSGDLFWHDIGADRRAREMAAAWMAENQNSNVLPEKMVVITSMEAAAVETVVDMWNKNTNSDIPFAYVRSASNFDHSPTDSIGSPLFSGKDSLENGMKDDQLGYPLKLQALPVLKLLENRSK